MNTHTVCFLGLSFTSLYNTNILCIDVDVITTSWGGWVVRRCGVSYVTGAST